MLGKMHIAKYIWHLNLCKTCLLKSLTQRLTCVSLKQSIKFKYNLELQKHPCYII